MKCRKITSGLLAAAVTCAGLLAPEASAALTFYYNPENGNVSFDTADAFGGQAISYGLYVPVELDPETGWHTRPSRFAFRPENHVRVSESQFYFSEVYQLTDFSPSKPLKGLYTIGDVLPPGLDEATWMSVFAVNNQDGTVDPTSATFMPGASRPLNGGGRGGHTYTAAIGENSPPARFVYGAPEGEFVNRWDLVDPDTLVWAQRASLIYRPWSGELLVDTTGPDSGHISSIWLRSADNAFVAENYTPIPDTLTTPALGGSISVLADAIAPGLYSLGHVLEPGLTPEEYEDVFSVARYLERAGFQGGSFDFETDGIAFTMVYVPEPLAASLLGLPCLLLLRRCSPA